MSANGKSIPDLLDELKEAHQRLEGFYSYSDETARSSGANLTEKQQNTLMDLRDENRRKERAVLVALIPLHLGVNERAEVSCADLGELLQDVSRQARLPA